MEVSINTQRGTINANIEDFKSDIFVVICHGFRGSQDEDLNKDLAKALTENKISNIRFDFGNGDGKSYGSINQITITDELKDLGDVVKYINHNKIVLIGHSLGGFVCSQYAAKNSIEKLILISPAYDFENRIRQFFGEEGIQKWRDGKIDELYPLIRKSSVFDVGKEFYKDISTYYPNNYKNIKCPTLLIQAENDTAIRSDQLDKYENILTCAKTRVKILDADHVYSKQQNREDVNQAVLNFLG